MSIANQNKSGLIYGAGETANHIATDIVRSLNNRKEVTYER